MARMGSELHDEGLALEISARPWEQFGLFALALQSGLDFIDANQRRL
jgi:hypothetical protein